MAVQKDQEKQQQKASRSTQPTFRNTDRHDRGQVTLLLIEPILVEPVRPEPRLRAGGLTIYIGSTGRSCKSSSRRPSVCDVLFVLAPPVITSETVVLSVLKEA